MSQQRDFNERFYAEYDLKFRVRIATLLSIILYPLFGILDAIVVPDWIGPFLLIRLVVVILNAVILYMISRVHKTRALLNLGLAMMIVDTLGIAAMVWFLGGFMSSYYQGFTLILVCMIAIMPWGLKENLIVSVVMWLSYVIPAIIGLNRVRIEFRIVVNNLFFLTSIIAIILVAAHFMYRIRCKALRNLEELQDTATALEASNKKLKSLDELKNQFFANISHELRTPLTLMLAPMGPLIQRNKECLPEAVLDTFTAMQRNGHKLLKRINELLDLAKLEVRKMHLRISKVDLVEYCTSLLSTVRPAAEGKGLTLSVEYALNEIEVFIDPLQFEKVILNLLSNAIKFTPQDGKIKLILEQMETNIQIVVEDTGEGIPDHMLESVFDRFSQVDGSMSRRHSGTGIGLALVKEIVELHKGTIRVESTLDQGSRFIVSIRKGEAHIPENVRDRRQHDQQVPHRRRASDQGSESTSDRFMPSVRELEISDLQKGLVPEIHNTPSKEREHTLLVIDDNPDMLKLAKFLLFDEFDLLLCESGEEGLKKAREKSPDLIMSDVMMPGMNGYELCQILKTDKDLKHVPVILVTANADSDTLVQGIDAGADDYVAKPFDPAELKARVRSLLRMRQIEAELARTNKNLRVRTDDLLERQKDLFLSTVKSLVSALEAKDEYTRNHSVRVTEYSLSIAKQMGLGEREISDLELAGLLHDVGKIAVPETVLHKPSRLTDEEFAHIKKHPAKGEGIIRPVIELQHIGLIVRAHHERYDGRGYPDGLNKQAIPLGARIMAVADTYDAMTSDRPYRKGLPHMTAVKEIVKFSGAQFDPEVVEYFLNLSETFQAIRNRPVESNGQT